MNWSEEKRIRLVDKSHEIKMIIFISPNRLIIPINRLIISPNRLIISPNRPQNPHGKHHLELSSLQCFLPYDFFVLLILMMRQVCFISFLAALNLCS